MYIIFTFQLYRLLLFLQHYFLSCRGLPGLKEVLHRRIHQFDGFNLLQWSYDAWAAKWSSTLLFFGGEESRNNYGRSGNSKMNSSRKDALGRRGLTTVLIAVNVV